MTGSTVIMAPSALKCNICPRKPKFSDVSHLLTHVSSKGHLSHYFKLQVRSHQEPQASELLAAYDEWYEKNKLASLLSDRMLAKESRTGKGSRNNTRATLPVAFSRPSFAPVNGSASSAYTADAKRPKNSLPSFMDPRLSQSYERRDPGPGNQEQESHAYPPMSVSRMINPHSYAGYVGNQQHRYQINSSYNTTPYYHPNWKDDDQTESEGEGSPLRGRGKGARSSMLDSSRRTTHRTSTPDPFVDDAAYEYYDDEEDEPIHRGTDEASRLKGIFWPGMDIFDSATEEMRRKRNQKKDGSILKQMEETSESVEPTELVFSPNGTLRKQRVISGMVDDSSPLKGETPIPKKRVSRPRRRALTQLNANAQMQLAQNRYKMRIREHDHASQLEQLSRQALMFDNPAGSISGDYDNGDGLTYPPLDSHRRRGLPVYRDDSSRGTFGTERSVNQNKPYYGSFKPAKSDTYRGKENIDPMYGSGQQKYYYGFAPHADNNAYGYSMNPLSYAAPQQTCASTANKNGTVDTSDLFVQPNSGIFEAGQTESPGRSMAEMGHDDMSQIYLGGLPE